MYKILSALPIALLVGCGASAQVRQDQLDFDKERLRIYAQNQIASDALNARLAESQAKLSASNADTCKVDANPGLCTVANTLASLTGKPATPVVINSIPTRTPVAPSKAGQIAGAIGMKLFDVGLAAYGIQQSNKTAQAGIEANKDTLIGVAGIVGGSAGTHVGDGSIFAGRDYTEDNSVDNSTNVGGNQSIAGRDQNIAEGDMNLGQIGDDVDTTVGNDLNTAGNDQIVGNNNNNQGRIGAQDGPYETTTCTSGETGNGAPGGNGATNGPGGTSYTNPVTGEVTCIRGR